MSTEIMSPALESSRRAPGSPPRAARGFALIEVMVTVLVISFGLISLAGLQLATKRGGNSSFQRSIALSLANEMLERISTNATVAGSYTTGLNGPLGAASLGVAPPTNCQLARCTPLEMANWDRWNWERRLDGFNITSPDASAAAGLIEPRGCVVFTPTDAAEPNTGVVRVIVSWRSLTDTVDQATAVDVTCGATGAGTDASRQQVVLNSYIVNPEDFAP